MHRTGLTPMCSPTSKNWKNGIVRRAAIREAEGPVRVSTAEPLNPIAEAFIEAGRQAGYGLTEDVNGYQQEGFGRFPMSAAGGFRSSTTSAYLKPARARENLTVRTGCIVDRVEVRNGRAETVRTRRNGRPEKIRALREIILCGGPINDPKLLMLSGIGPADQLRQHGITVTHDLPGVGDNLQDHAIGSVQLKSSAPVSLASHLGLFAKVQATWDWLTTRQGVLASNHFQCGAFIRSQAGIPFPDLQLFLFPIAVKFGTSDFHSDHGFQVQISPQRSQSRGWVRLRSADPDDPPRILTNMMSQEQDWIEMRAALRLTREILAQPAMDFCRGDEMAPGPKVRTDAEIDAFLRDQITSSYHPSGTCKMGTDDMAVVDPGVPGSRDRWPARRRQCHHAAYPKLQPECSLHDDR